MADLKISTAILERVEADLNVILTAFQDASGIAGDVAEATGNERLYDRVDEFAGSWDDKREEMVEQITALVG